jgi:hypothetical protein
LELAGSLADNPNVKMRSGSEDKTFLIFIGLYSELLVRYWLRCFRELG